MKLIEGVLGIVAIFSGFMGVMIGNLIIKDGGWFYSKLRGGDDIFKSFYGVSIFLSSFFAVLICIYFVLTNDYEMLKIVFVMDALFGLFHLAEKDNYDRNNIIIKIYQIFLLVIGGICILQYLLGFINAYLVLPKKLWLLIDYIYIGSKTILLIANPNHK